MSGRAAACTRKYDRQSMLPRFSDGFNHEPLLAMRRQMRQAAENRQYELAGRAHAMTKSLEYVDRKFGMLARARRRYTFIYAVPGFVGCGAWYLIHCGEIADVVAAPRDRNEYRRLHEKIGHWSAVTSERLARGHGIRIRCSWSRPVPKHRDELRATFPPSQAFKDSHFRSRSDSGVSGAL